jgi:precorrin-2 dehydrogenase
MMLPLSLDASRLRLALVGNGAGAARRLAWLDEAGAAAVTVYAAAPAPALAAAAGGRLRRHWPDDVALREAQLVFIADVPEPQRDALAHAARQAGAILHVEDEPALCDAHAPAVLRRGDLLIAISTGGAAPALAAALKDFLSGIFGREWRGRLDEVKALRQRARAAGASHALVRHMIAAQIAKAGWLEASHQEAANDRGSSRDKRGDQSCR